MSTSEKVNLALTITGSIGLVLTLFFLILQTRQLSAQTRLSTYLSVTSQICAIDQLFIAHPELRPFFYDGKSLSDVFDKHAVYATAELVLDFFESLLTVIEDDSAHTPDQSWSKYMQAIMKSSPVMCEYLREHEDWYTSSLYKLLATSRGDRD